MEEGSMRRNTLIAGTVLLGILHLATLRPGHDWGDDFSLYVAHARNLAHGLPYADTGYIYNPHLPVLSPRTYPPVFPLLLVPVYQVFGMNLLAMKVFVVLVFMAFLAVLAVLLRRRLSAPYVLGCLWLVGLNPFVWQHKDRLLSEVPFLLFAYLALLFMEHALAAQEKCRRVLPWGVLAGVATYLAFGTRVVGVVLVPALLACEMHRRRRPGFVSACVLVPFAALVLVQKAIVPGDASYFDQLRFDVGLFARVALGLVKAMAMFFDNGYLASARLVLFLSLLALAGAGFVSRLRQQPTPSEFFAAFSVLLLVFWPDAEEECRYLVPVLPLFLFYACAGLRRTAARLPRPGLRRRAAIGVALAVLVSYAGSYTRLEFGPFRQGVSTPQAKALFEFIRTRTHPDDVFLFQKPRALALFTGRRASAHHVPESDEQLFDYLRQINATHLVVTPQFPSSYQVLGPFIRRNAELFDTVFQSGDITVYRLIDGLRASGVGDAATGYCLSPVRAAETAGSVVARFEHAAALASLEKALGHNPRHEEARQLRASLQGK
jgi:4-amino-4-deoxy-L-arabinose transferase-like glycosyltransferase